MGPGHSSKPGRPGARCAWASACAGALLGCGGGKANDRPADAAAPTVDAGQGECRSHGDCVDKHTTHWICRRDRTCVNLISPECSYVGGDATDDDAVLVGVLATDASRSQLFGASELVRTDFRDSVGDAPRAGQRHARPFVLVGCCFPYGGDPLPAGRRLVEEIGVTAIIGPVTSPDVINVAQNLTIPAGVLMVSPSASSDLVTELADKGLVFRTTSTTKALAPQIAAMVSDVEALARTQRGLAEVKVAVVSERDAYGLALAEATADILRFNGGLDCDENEDLGHFLAVSYDGSDEGYEKEVAARVLAFAPTIVVSLTAFDALPFQAIEEAWPMDTVPPPYYVADGGSSSPAHAKLVASRPDGLRQRLHIASNLDPERPLYKRFADRAQGEPAGSLPLPMSANTYDAAYAVGYAIVAAGDEPITGATLARAFGRLVGKGTTISTVPEQIARGVGLLRSGKDIDIDGASGPLDFDTQGDVLTDGSVWCFLRDSKSGEVVPSFGGQVYRAATGKLEGSFACD